MWNIHVICVNLSLRYDVGLLIKVGLVHFIIIDDFCDASIGRQNTHYRRTNYNNAIVL